LKDHLRDYVTAAFRFYARSGMSAENYKKQLDEEALVDKMSEIKDMEAVELTLDEIRANHMNYPGMLRVIEMVYFTDAKLPLPKGAIKDRIHKAEFDTHVSERNIYRYLKKARLMFAKNRGLRI